MIPLILFTLLIPFAGTALGAALVFVMRRDIAPKVQKGLLGFASGVMVAASVWSLLIPSIDMSDGRPWHALGGILAGFAFLLLLDEMTPHIHPASNESEGPRSKLSRTAMLTLAVTLHNIPEGMALGVGLVRGYDIGWTEAAKMILPLAIGIAVQNFPEGAIISLPMRAEGNSKLRSFTIGALSGAVEPIACVLLVMMASILVPILPFLLAFAAGAMLYVVVEELIPEASLGSHSNAGTIGFAVGFAGMMLLDTLLG